MRHVWVGGADAGDIAQIAKGHDTGQIHAGNPQTDRARTGRQNKLGESAADFGKRAAEGRAQHEREQRQSEYAKH